MIRTVPQTSFTLYDLLFKNFYDSRADFSVLDQSFKSNYPVDISTSDTGLTLEIACVGIDKEDIKIHRSPDYLRIKYTKPDPDQKNYILSSISKKSFDLGYKVSAKYDLEKMKANLEKGLLSINIPVREGEQLHEVQIE